MSSPSDRPLSDAPSLQTSQEPTTPAKLFHQDALLDHIRHSLASSSSAPATVQPSHSVQDLRRNSAGSSSDTGRPSSSKSDRLRNVSNQGGVHNSGQGLGKLQSREEVATKVKPVGAKARLKKEESGVVRRRDGNVLVRGCILKTDHFPTGRALDLDFHLEGAPNFRAPSDESLNVFGVAQPTLSGLRSILSLLGCRPAKPTTALGPDGEKSRSKQEAGKSSSNGRQDVNEDGGESPMASPAMVNDGFANPPMTKGKGKCVWFCTREEPIIYISGRPFVLRDSASAQTTLALADRASTLEQIERRLKKDILRESHKYGGLILTHDELIGGELEATWCAVDEGSVLTVREAWEKYKDEGWALEYHRTPISSDRPIEDNVLDAYIDGLKDVDPLTTSVIFNDGLGAVRATFGMLAGLLIRRKQHLLRDMDDPITQPTSGLSTPVPGVQAVQYMKQAAQQQKQNKSLLRLSATLHEVLEGATNAKTATTATELLSTNTQLLDSLRAAHMGNYQIVLSLLSSIDHGRETKARVDGLIDSCEAVINLREIIVEYRMQYSVSSADEKTRVVWLNKAVQALERYYFLIAFASYVEEEDAGSTGKRFSEWLTNRPEVWTQIQVLRRKAAGSRLFVFNPINDLQGLSKAASKSMTAPARRDMEQSHILEAGEQPDRVIGDEFSAYVIAQRSGIILRAGTLLKVDQWVSESATSLSAADRIKGAIGFRRVPQTNIYALGQPEEDAIAHVVRHVCEGSQEQLKVLWLNLREEPVVMIVGEPYCLRKENMSLRNLRDYSGMSGSRLEVLEDRLVSDVLSELRTFDNKLLVHAETDDGLVAPTWEDVTPGEVKSLRTVMDQAAKAARLHGGQLEYRRLPITAQSTIDFQDVNEIISLCLRHDLERTAIVLNDQLGRGRSSSASVIFVLVLQWLRRSQSMGNSFHSQALRTPRILPSSSTSTATWQVVNNTLRVLRRNGIEIKRIVDDAIDRCGAAFNLREKLADQYQLAEDESDPNVKKLLIKDGKILLLRYTQLIQLQAYLEDLQPDDDLNNNTFARWHDAQPVFKTFESDIRNGGIEVLVPLSTSENISGPVSDEAAIAARNGSVLSKFTIIKSDLFTGLQKQSLPDRVDGAANYRQVPLILNSTEKLSDALSSEKVYGTGMPTDRGLRNALHRMGAGPDGARTVHWTCLREEPVLYCGGKPFVLRNYNEPIVNIETTGVTAAVVQAIEEGFKRDVLREVAASPTGRLLLHDEVETHPGTFDIIPIWQETKAEEILTPRELFEQVIQEGYRLSYERIAITDEQAPLPETFSLIIDRVKDGLTKGETDFVFNCQMGRGRTTTGMIASSIIASILSTSDPSTIAGDSTDGSALSDMTVSTNSDSDLNEERAFRSGEYRMILHLVTVLSYGREAKKIADKAIDAMAGVQNLREAIYDFKLKLDACDPKDVTKYRELQKRAINYAYRYAMLIVLTAYLLEMKDRGSKLTQGSESSGMYGQRSFSAWLEERREIRTVLSRQTLD